MRGLKNEINKLNKCILYDINIDNDEYRLQYYSYQIDKSKYVTTLLKHKYLTNLNDTLDKDKLDNTLFILKEKYINGIK